MSEVDKVPEASDNIRRTFTITVTPEELAALFCSMLSDEQARFFSHVGKIAAGWPGAGWCQQCCGISQHLDKIGTEAILKLGVWAAEPYREPELAGGAS
jgi:hypothetical protein